jgi:hypothetical protein
VLAGPEEGKGKGVGPTGRSGTQCARISKSRAEILRLLGLIKDCEKFRGKMDKLVAVGSGVALSSLHDDREGTSFFRCVYFS